MDGAPPALLPASPRRLRPAAGPVLPPLVVAAGDRASTRLLEFFASTLHPPQPAHSPAYARVMGDFLIWCEDHAVDRRCPAAARGRVD